MDALLELIASLFAAFGRRGERRPSLAGVLREALVQRVAPPSSRAAAPAAVSSPASAVPVPLSTPAAAPVAGMRSRSVELTDPAAEVRLVTGLFASPQSLVAAFIVSEVLAKPVALRDR